MRVELVLAGLLVISPLAWAGTSIPSQFRGEWNEDLKQCGKGENDSFLYIERRKVTFWESQGPVRAAVVRGNELALILELTEPDGTWLETAQFELSADGTKLTSNTSSENNFVRFAAHIRISALTIHSTRCRFAARVNSGVRAHWSSYAD